MKTILVGTGEVIFFLARLFLSKGYEVSIINPDRDECAHLEATFKATVINGDGTDPQTLDKADAKNAQILIAATNYDHMNLSCCQAAMVQYQTPHTLAVVNDPDNVEIFKKLGIKYIFNKTDLIVSLLERTAESTYVTPILSYSGGKMLMYEVRLNSRMPSIGLEPHKINIPSEARILGIIRDSVFETADHISLQNNDRLILATTPEALAYSIRLLCGSEA